MEPSSYFMFTAVAEDAGLGATAQGKKSFLTTGIETDKREETTDSTPSAPCSNRLCGYRIHQDGALSIPLCGKL